MTENSPPNQTPTPPPSQTHCGFIAIIGKPNAGKSTLLNRLLGQKLAIVSAKPQTTRTRMLAVHMVGQTQMVLLDTPGLFAPRKKLDEAMVRAAAKAAGDADCILWLIAADDPPDDARVAETLALFPQQTPIIVALNKIDLLPPAQLLPLAARFGALPQVAQLLMISASSGSGVADLEQAMAKALPAGPWHYPPEQITDLPEKLLAAELTREQVFLQLEQELPYATTVETEQWEEKPNGNLRLGQLITVQRDGQKAIIIGKGGSRLKAIGSAARAEIAKALGRKKVELFLTVRVRADWAEKSDYYKMWGLD